ncbi:MAG: hypothetical protein II955_06675, partial [Clostridia bacterium]|nr:hypothetical protein [Clostridia bacterium]
KKRPSEKFRRSFFMDVKRIKTVFILIFDLLRENMTFPDSQAGDAPHILWKKGKPTRFPSKIKRSN